jgi:hypothetical protein
LFSVAGKNKGDKNMATIKVATCQITLPPIPAVTPVPIVARVYNGQPIDLTAVTQNLTVHYATPATVTVQEKSAKGVLSDPCTFTFTPADYDKPMAADPTAFAVAVLGTAELEEDAAAAAIAANTPVGAAVPAAAPVTPAAETAPSATPPAASETAATPPAQ